MSPLKPLLPALFLSGVHAMPGMPYHTLRNEGIQWGECVGITHVLPIECANFTVPLDYTNPKANETLDLALIKVPAVKPTYTKKSIIFNFGGPGLEVRHTLAAQDETLQAITGGEFDLIGFDPRGTADTMTFTCFDDDLERSQLINRFASSNASDVALGGNWATGTKVGQTCYGRSDSNKKGSLIGTAAVARDIMQIVDALGEDGMIRYWGLSYGTTLGSTLAAMFPDKVDKVLLDGVMNVHQYYDGYDSEMWADTDATIREVFKTCLANADVCPLAHSNATVESLEEALLEALQDVKYNPIAWPDGPLLDYSTLGGILRFALYSPTQWPIFAAFLDSLFTGDLAKGTEAVNTLVSGSLLSPTDESAYGIQCSDKFVRSDSLEGVMPAIEEVGDYSKYLGDVMPALFMLCAQWPLEAKERYAGGFEDVKTENPVFFIGNSFDPATPLRSAHNMSAGFDGSVVLEHGGHGHATLAEPSICTAKAVQAYFKDGVLPEPGTYCESDAPPFSPSAKTWPELLPELGYTPAKPQRKS